MISLQECKDEPRSYAVQREWKILI